MGLDPNGLALVTGGSGFIGGALVRRLLVLGWKVRVISRSTSSVRQDELKKHIRDPGQLEWFKGDLECLSSIGAAFADVKYVFHVAALVASTASRDACDKANVRATINVCDLSLRNSVPKLIYVSTADVFGLPSGAEIITEQTPYRPWNEPYADSKIRATEVVKAYRSQGLVSSIIYPGWVYGPGDQAFLPAVVRQIRSGLVPIWSPESFEIPLVFIEDLVDGLLKAAANADADNDDFLLLDDASGISARDLCEQVASYFDLEYRSISVPYQIIYLFACISQQSVRLGLAKRPLLTTTDVKSFGYRFRFSTAKARDVLEWSPSTPFVLGIKAALQWHAANSIEPETKSV
jgi:nucleoside-diphosphate-sugar epimerase